MRLSDITIMGIAGRVSREMLEHYSHIRLQAKRHALESLDRAFTIAQNGTESTSSSDAKLGSFWCVCVTKRVTKEKSESCGGL